MSTEALNNIIITASILSGFGAVLVGSRKRKKHSLPIAIIFYLAIFSLSSDLVSLILAKNGISNLWLINIYELILGLSCILFFYLTDRKYFKRLKIVLPFFTVLFAGTWFNSLPIKLNMLNGFGMVFESFIIIVISIFFFYRIYVNSDSVFIERSPNFLIAIGILFYFSGALFSFLLWADMLSSSPNDFYHSWILHNVSNILKNVFFAMAFLKSRVNEQ